MVYIGQTVDRPFKSVVDITTIFKERKKAWYETFESIRFVSMAKRCWERLTMLQTKSNMKKYVCVRGDGWNIKQMVKLGIWTKYF